MASLGSRRMISEHPRMATRLSLLLRQLLLSSASVGADDATRATHVRGTTVLSIAGPPDAKPAVGNIASTGGPSETGHRPFCRHNRERRSATHGSTQDAHAVAWARAKRHLDLGGTASPDRTGDL